MTIHSWGNYPKEQPNEILDLNWCDENIFDKQSNHFLAYGQGRSYGDSCLNNQGTLIKTNRFNRFITFDVEKGILECEGGITFAEIIDLIVPRGWFLPVVPGTKFVSLGGAIANDIHGKNHHLAGTFGRHILGFTLSRSNGENIYCTPTSNRDLFKATISGLGLTGIILNAKIQLKPITSATMEVDYQKFSSLEAFFQIAKESEQNFEYTVAWLDCLADAKNFGRGIFMRANHHMRQAPLLKNKSSNLSIPFFFPTYLLNKYSIKVFNSIYYYTNKLKRGFRLEPIDKFFFPLDSINNWNKIYGEPGFVQYQFVLPEQNALLIGEILQCIVRSRQASFLTVLKTFGDLKSPGMLSFPKQGVTLALDLPFRGKITLNLLESLDKMVIAGKGSVYPAKDARMSAHAFKNYFPQWKDFISFVDPKFSSSFWRRVMNNEN